MGTSTNKRSPDHLRWRTAHSALIAGQRPRALREFFSAAAVDGWARALSSEVVTAYARGAARSWDQLPSKILENRNANAAIRAIVDESRLESMESTSFSSANVVPALAERALMKTLLERLQKPGQLSSSLAPDQAIEEWTKERGAPQKLVGTFLLETIAQLTLHLVHRDAPQFVVQLGGAREIGNLAQQLAESARGFGLEAAAMLEAQGLDAWPAAVESAGAASQTLPETAPGESDGI